MTKRTTTLVVGLQDKERLNGYPKSSKHRKAESLVSKGAGIQILSEADFPRCSVSPVDSPRTKLRTEYI